MSVSRIVVGILVMAIAVPIAIFLFLRLHTFPQFFTIAAITFVAWGVADLLASILERPRLKDRSPKAALREDLERRSKE